MKPLKILILSLTILVAFIVIGGQSLTYDASVIPEKEKNNNDNY